MPVVLHSPGELHVETRDIGPGGAFVRSTAVLAVCSRVKMNFTVLAQDVFSQDFLFRCDGTVVRLEQLANGVCGSVTACRSLEEDRKAIFLKPVKKV